MKRNTCILFSGGSYGTFVEWCLNYFTNLDFNGDLPFNANGNAHLFIGNHLVNFQGYKDYIQSTDRYEFVRFHPKTSKDEDIISNLQFVNQQSSNVIYLTSDINSIAWIINNKFTKIGNKELGWMIYNESQILDNIKQWGSELTATSMANWEYREFLSLYIYQQHLAETELNLNHDIQSMFPNVCVTNIAHLRDSFEHTILELIKYCGLTPVRQDQLAHIYNQWMNVQHHAFKDKLIDDIITAIITDQYYDWSLANLTIIDEAMIQYYLRLKNIAIKCYALNSFPTNTTDLRTYFE